MLLRSGRISTYPNETLEHAFINASDFKISLVSFEQSLIEHINHTVSSLVDSITYFNNLLVAGVSKSSKGKLIVYKVNLIDSNFEIVDTINDTLGRPVRILHSPDNLVVLHSLGLCFYNTSNNNFLKFNQISCAINQIANSPHKPSILAAASQFIELLDYRKKGLFTGIKTKFCHRGNVTFVDFNPNVENALVTSGIDGHLAFWDIRAFKHPLKIGKISDNWVTSVKYNPFHDQFLITTDICGAIKLITSDFEKITSTKTKFPIYNADWSCTDSWTYVFQDESYEYKSFKREFVPREIKYRVLLGDDAADL